MSVSWPGTTEAFAQANIYARASGYISKRNVDIGSQVKAGDLLVEITAPELDHQIAQAEGTLAQLQAALQQAKAQRDLAQVTWDRDNPLVQKGWVTPQQGDTDRLTLQSRDAAVAVAQANIEAQNAQLRVLNQQKAYQSVVAPFNGVITQRNVDIGSAGAGGRDQRHVPVHPDAERRAAHPALRPAGRSLRRRARRRGDHPRAGNARPRFSRQGDAHRRRVAARHAHAADRDRRAQSGPRAAAGSLLQRRAENPAQDAVADRAVGGDHLQSRRAQRGRGRGRRRAHPPRHRGARLRHHRRGECRRQGRRSGDPQSAGRSDRRPQGADPARPARRSFPELSNRISSERRAGTRSPRRVRAPARR